MKPRGGVPLKFRNVLLVPLFLRLSTKHHLVIRQSIRRIQYYGQRAEVSYRYRRATHFRGGGFFCRR